jgi:hypothetical protein
MATTTVAINLEAKTKGTDSVKSLKAQIREATQEATALAQKFGEFSPEATRAAQRVAELKDEMDDFQQKVQALNPDKFNRINTIAKGVANGFQAAQGAMALFGAESEDVQKALLKVQGAMALAQGLEGLGEATKQLKALGLRGLEAFKSLTVSSRVFVASGIGLIITALAVVIGYWDDIKAAIGITQKSTEDLEAAQKKYNETVEQNAFLTQTHIKEVERQEQVALANAKARGAGIIETNNIIEKALEKRIKYLKEEADAAGAGFRERVKGLKESDEAYKEALAEYQKTIRANGEQIEDAENKIFINRINANNEFEKQQAESAKREAERQRQLREKAAADALQRRATLLALEQDTLAQQIAAADAAFATRIKGYREQNYTEFEINKLRDAELEKIRTEFYAKQKADQEKAAADRKAIADKEIADTVKSTDDFFKGEQVKNIDNNEVLAQLEVERLETQLQNAKDYGQSTVDLELQLAQKRKEIKDKEVEDTKKAEEAKRQMQMDTLTSVSSILGSLGDLAGENEKAQKAFGLAQIATDTAIALSNAQASAMSPVSPDNAATGGLAGIAKYATYVAIILANAARARAILKGGGGGASGGAAAVGSAPAPAVPLTGGALPEEAQFGGMGRVYVLEGDITKTQTRVRRLRNTSVV